MHMGTAAPLPVKLTSKPPLCRPINGATCCTLIRLDAASETRTRTSAATNRILTHTLGTPWACAGEQA